MQHYSLKLDSESIIFDSAFNDCCCHIAVSQQTIPLDKVQDVQLQSGCLQTCFGLKEVRVQTAGVNQAGRQGGRAAASTKRVGRGCDELSLIHI